MPFPIIVVLTFVYCYDIYRSGARVGGSGLGAIYAAKSQVAGTNIVIRQFVKIIMSVAFIHALFFADLILYQKRKGLENLIHIIPLICAIVCSLFTGVRTDMMRILTAILVDYCIILFQNKTWKKRSAKTFVKRIVPLIVFSALFMTIIRFVVKGTENATSNTYGVIMYICYYVGSPMLVLGSKLSIGIDSFKRNIWGEITFSGLWEALVKIGLLKDIDIEGKSTNIWISQSDRITANVDTVFGAPTIDFGIIGMCIYILILFYILNRFYYKYLYKSKSGLKRDTMLIVYSNLAIISSMAYYGNLASMFGSLYYILTVVLSVVIFKYVYKPRYNMTE